MRVPLEILVCLEQLTCTYGILACKPTSLQRPSGSHSRLVQCDALLKMDPRPVDVHDASYCIQCHTIPSMTLLDIDCYILHKSGG